MAEVTYAYIQLPDGSLFPTAQETLAEMFDIGVNECGIEGGDLVAAFIASGLDREFEHLNPVYVAGKSAIELIELLAPFLDVDVDLPRVVVAAPLVDYWVGWSVANYQYETGTPYRRMFEAVPYEEFAASYHPLHEAPESKFIEVFEKRIREKGSPTRLSVQRRVAGMSQAELAEQAGVGLRSIQMYEQRNKNINHASAETLLRLSRVLHCGMEDLMEL
ncbi:MAG: helix-turn-helix transcriptional regulator [Eggerthellaceae bacterium]|nr:helix-turn-helix transcriptional regulator [Eggerthellaceae bacterium]MBQ9044211.1 helix-turn-helix transcriptional regulator [Eggerthellaceae bacterium]